VLSCCPRIYIHMWNQLSACVALTVPLAVYSAYISATFHLIRCALMTSTLSSSMIKGYTVLVLLRLVDWLRTTACSILSLGILRKRGDHYEKRATVVVDDATTLVDMASVQDDCPICMEHTRDEHGNNLSWCKCRQCNHSFHTTCLESWVKTGGSCCPTCRRAFDQSGNVHAPHAESLITVTDFNLSLFEFALHVVGLCIYVSEAQMHTYVHQALVQFCLTGLLSTAMTVSIIVGALRIATQNMVTGGVTELRGSTNENEE